jgi:large subunit ribosomal protein L25
LSGGSYEYAQLVLHEALRRFAASLQAPSMPPQMERNMVESTQLAATLRTKDTKGAARAARREGKVPAVIYGDKIAPALIAIEHNVLVRHVNRADFMTHLFDIEIDGKKHRVLPRDVQFDPVSDRPLHVDFLRVSANTRVRVNVPVVFTNLEKSPGIKRGGTINIVHHEIEVTCAPGNIPARFEISMEGLNINEAVHLSSLVLPKDVKLTTTEKEFTIATIAVPSAIRSENEAAAAAAGTPAAAAAPAAAAPAAGGKAAPAAAAGAKAAAPAAGAKPAAKPAAKK